MGLPYPGGPEIDKLAKTGDATAIDFPHPKVDGYDFSFSGLKSAVLNFLNTAQMKGDTLNAADVAASFQKTVVDILAEKTLSAADEFNLRKIVWAASRQIRRSNKLCAIRVLNAALNFFTRRKFFARTTRR